jgi:DNA-binding response OmpR family regulator
LPRGWLESVRPLIAVYLDSSKRGTPKPASKKEWLEIRKHNPPRFSFDEKTGQVTIGWRQITDLSPEERNLLGYLYKHRGKICPKRDLYLRAYLELYPQRKPSSEVVTPKDYEQLIDTAIWRLRKAIEPIPRTPLFVVTVKNQGIRLENAW